MEGEAAQDAQDWNVEFINSYFGDVHPGKVSCEVTETKGRILIARRAYRAGEVIFEERPLHIATAVPASEAYKTLVRLCKKYPDAFEQDALWYWTALCSLTAKDLGDSPKRSTLPPAVSEDLQRKVLCLYHEPVTEPSEAAVILLREFQLPMSGVLMSRLIRAWILNCFDHTDEPQGYASYFGASFMSHSCHPNAVWHFAEGTAQEDTFVLHARRDVREGDEITISYLPENGLLQAAAARRRELQASKSFLCRCERCGPGAKEPDTCRGFRCPSCFHSAVLHPGPLDGSTLSTASCSRCGAAVGEAEAKRLLAAESDLIKRLDALDAKVEKRPVGKLLQVVEVQQLLRLVGDSAAGAVGPQHWACDRLWGHLADWYEQRDMGEDACRMLRLRVAYQRQGYGSPHGALAWTLEELAALLLRQGGVGSSAVRLAGLDDAAVRRMSKEACSHLEEAAGLLRMLFGETHSYFVALDRRRGRVAEFLETGAWPKPAAALKRKIASSR